MAVTLSELQRRFFDRMDEGSSQYISTAQATDVLNEAYSLLWSLYCERDPKFFETIASITPLVNVRDYPLPTDFRRLTKLYALPTPGATPQQSYHVPLARTMRDEYQGTPSVYNYYQSESNYIPTYEIYGNTLRLDPTPRTAPTFTLSLWYMPHYTPLVNGTDLTHVAIYPGHEQLIINQAVIMIKVAKEEV